MPINAQHLAPQSGGFEPQRAYDFQIELYGVPNAGNLTLAVSEGFLPERMVDEIKLYYGAEDRKVAGLVSFSNGRMTCVDYLDEQILSSMLEWSRMVYDIEAGTEGLASAYKKQGALVLLAPDGSRPRIYQMLGVWPKSVSGSGLSYGTNDVLKVTMELVFDQAIPKF